jgi:hypothetical protein
MRSHAGMAIQTRERRLALRASPPLVRPLVGWFGHQLVTNHQGVNIAGTPHRGTFPQHNRALSHRPPRNRVPCPQHTVLPVNSSSGSPRQHRCRHTTRLTGLAAALALHRPLQRLTGYSAPAQRPRYARRSSATGELVTRLQLLAHIARDLIAPTRRRTRPSRLTVSAPECGTTTSKPTPSTISVRPFSGPHILKEWFASCAASILAHRALSSCFPQSPYMEGGGERTLFRKFSCTHLSVFPVNEAPSRCLWREMAVSSVFFTYQSP